MATKFLSGSKSDDKKYELMESYKLVFPLVKLKINPDLMTAENPR